MLGALAWQARGQTLVRAGYDDPSTVRIAPGQVVTLSFAGLKTVVPGGIQRATTTPLPLSLAGISATLRQTLPESVKSLPVFSVKQFNRCAGSAVSADCLITALTIQIPFEITVPNPFLGSAIPTGNTTIAISENGNMSREFTVYPVPDQVHVLTSCDVNGSAIGTGVCFPLVTHDDGSLVQQALRAADATPLTASEAHPGEVLTMYLYGLGTVTPAISAGDVTPVPAPVTSAPVTLRFDYQINAAPSVPPGLPAGAPPPAAPPFAGLAPNQIGVYQINFVVPPVPPGTPSCGYPVNSNLTISVSLDRAGASSTFDGAAICVTPQ